MLLDIRVSAEKSLSDLVGELDVHPPGTSFGPDIDAVQTRLLDPAPDDETRARLLRGWLGRHQPCLFGRLGAKGQRGVGVDICWIGEDEIAQGDTYLEAKIQKARRRWKDRAEKGIAHGFLIMFSGPRLAFARPGESLLKVCDKISNLYLTEHAPVERDAIYTEAAPLRVGERLQLFKAGINIFYPSAHRTRNHDRRIPGGILISVNSVGHLANSLVERGLAQDLNTAVDQMMDLALRSIGNGGLGHDGMESCTWHNAGNDPRPDRRALGALPHYIPPDHSQSAYTGVYHTDVLIPTDVTADGRIDPDLARAEQWKALSFDYISDAVFAHDHENYGFFRGHPVADEAKYHNPWPPLRAVNTAAPQRRPKAASIGRCPFHHGDEALARVRT